MTRRTRRRKRNQEDFTMFTRTTLILIFLFSFLSLCQAQSKSSDKTKSNTTSQPTNDQQADDEKKFDPPPVLTLNADRDLIVKLLMKQMKDKEFRLTKKEPDVLVFEKRIPGAEAAIKRNGYDRSTMTPIVDDPKMIMAFGFESKEKGTLIVARMIETTVIGIEIFRRDVTEKKQGRVSLNKILEQLKLDLEREQNSNK